MGPAENMEVTVTGGPHQRDGNEYLREDVFMVTTESIVTVSFSWDFLGGRPFQHEKGLPLRCQALGRL